MSSIPDLRQVPPELLSRFFAEVRQLRRARRAELPRIEGYEILDRLGEGSSGTVWRVRQLSTGRLVALKVLNVSAFGSLKARLRFEREVELISRLSHPHIARIYDSGIDRG